MTDSEHSECGDFTVWRRHNPTGLDGLYIERADPRILIANELLQKIAESDDPRVHYDGERFRIDADNRTVVYRIVGFDRLPLAHIAEWPD